MKRIKSFEVNHNILQPGIYVSRRDDDIVTYDLRFVKPNGDKYLENDSIHTIEHLFATYVRNSAVSDKVIYFGPMGCRTGFYFIVRGLDEAGVINIVKETIDFICGYEGEIPGCSAIECGNYLDHNLSKAKADCAIYKSVIEDWMPENTAYLL